MPTSERPKAVDVLTGVIEQVIPYRFDGREPTISDLARMVSTASRLIRFDNIDERIEVENATVLRLAKQRQLMS
jgi:hypothetical protein